MSVAVERHILTSPGIRGGKAHVVGTRIAVTDIVVLHLRLGQALEQIAAHYQLPLAAVYSAMAYYFDHQREIDSQLADDEAYIASVGEQHRSKLQRKLRALNGE